MRKQTAIEFRTFNLGVGAGGESRTNQSISQEIEQVYLKNGWEVFHTEIAQLSAGVIYILVVFTKYEDVVEPTPSKK